MGHWIIGTGHLKPAAPATPTIDEVRSLLTKLLELSWLSYIGEASDLAAELLDYIDGKPGTVRWQQSFDRHGIR